MTSLFHFAVLRSAPWVLSAGVSVAILAGCATTGPRPSQSVDGADAGYFLSLRQKGQLIWTGCITDSCSNRYDVWIVPGYVVPARRMVKYLGRAGDSLAEYGGRQKYRDLSHASGDALAWAYDDCLKKFVVKGVPRAWGKYFGRASERSEKRVFGWWFAYPWAVMEGTVDTVVRVPLGVAGSVLGVAAGGVIVPGFYAVNSTVAGACEFAGGAVVGPLVADAWNTVIAPPMALVGQKPTISRVDGYWVTLVTHEEQERVRRKSIPATPEEIAALASWGRTLLTESRALDSRRQQAEKERTDAYKAVDVQYRVRQKEIAEQERTRMAAAAEAPAVHGSLDTLRQRNFDRDRIPAAFDEVEKQLRADGISATDLGRVRQLLNQYPPAESIRPAPVQPIPPVPAVMRQKTDPLQESLQVIKQVSD